MLAGMLRRAAIVNGARRHLSGGTAMPARKPVPPPYAGELVIPDGDDVVRLEPLQVTLKEAARLLAYDLRTIQRLISSW
jgi:hypothetical protein